MKSEKRGTVIKGRNKMERGRQAPPNRRGGVSLFFNCPLFWNNLGKSIYILKKKDNYIFSLSHSGLTHAVSRSLLYIRIRKRWILASLESHTFFSIQRKNNKNCYLSLFGFTLNAHRFSYHTSYFSDVHF